MPPTKVGRPLLSSISPTRLVQVVFPLVPVIPILGPGQSPTARASSPQMGIFSLLAALSIGVSSGMPGDGTMSWLERIFSLEWPPASIFTPCNSHQEISSSGHFFKGKTSLKTHSNPWVTAHFAAERPLFPIPRTAILLITSYLSLSVLTPTNPSMMARIQKRTMTLGSGQPFSSK